MLLMHYHLILPILFLTGLSAGLVDAIAGGGGLVSVPVLFAIGMPPHLVLGTNKFQSVCGTSMATYKYYQKGWLVPRKLILGLVVSFFGSIIGAILAQSMSADFLKKIIPLLLLCILVYTIFSPRLGIEKSSPKINETLFYLFFGLLLGFYDGFFGPGVGAFWTFFLMFFLGKDLAEATAQTKAFNMNTNLAALVCFMLGNNVDYRIAICMAAGQLVGGKLGAQLTISRGVKFIRPVFLTVVTVTIGVLAYKNFSTIIQNGLASEYRVVFSHFGAEKLKLSS